MLSEASLRPPTPGIYNYAPQINSQQRSDIVAKNISNNRTQEPEAGGSQDLGQFELQGMILSLKTKQNRSRFTREMTYNLRAKWPSRLA